MSDKQVLISREELYPIYTISTDFTYKGRYDVEASLTEEEFNFVNTAIENFDKVQNILGSKFENEC